MRGGPLIVVGDALLDVDVQGSSERQCPDAPAPVVDARARQRRPGGAGLAAELAARSGSAVSLLTGLGLDAEAAEFAGALDTRVRLLHLPFRGSTPSKTRVCVGGRPLARVDDGDGRVVDEPMSAAVVAELRRASAVLVSDYGRGATWNRALRAELEALPPEVALVWDPHPRGAPPVRRTDVVLPNESEAAQFAGGAEDHGQLAEQLRQRWFGSGPGAVVVTLGAEGALLAAQGTSRRFDVPSAPVHGGETCGAGDSFAVHTALALRAGQTAEEAVAAGVRSAARFVGAGAARSVSTTDRSVRPAPDAFALAEQVRAAGGTVVATGGCFDLLHRGHLGLLDQARSLGDALVVCLNSDESVRRNKGPTRPVQSAEDRERLLRALAPVDAVATFDETTPCALLRALRPDVWVKGGDYTGRELPEQGVVDSCGGRTVVLPRLGERSTTGLLNSAATAV